MKHKNMIIIAATIILLAFAAQNLTKSDINIAVHAEKIPGTSEEIYIIYELQDEKGNIVDTPFGKLTSEFSTDNENTLIIYEGMPVEHGKHILRYYGKPTKINVKYDGGYFHNPANYNRDLVILNSTNLTDDNLTSYF